MINKEIAIAGIKDNVYDVLKENSLQDSILKFVRFQENLK